MSPLRILKSYFSPNLLLASAKFGCVDAALSGVYTSDLFNDLDFLIWAKYCSFMIKYFP